MPDYKKLDDEDIFISGRPTPEGDRAFSEYLKSYKARQARSKREEPSVARKKKAGTKVK